MTAIPSKSILDGSSTPTTAQFKSAMGQLHDFLSERTDVAATASGLTVSTNNRVLGRSTAGAGAIEELTIGTGANNLVRLDSSARLPAVDGSLLTNLPQQGNKQLQSVGASVATNALTVNLNPTSLDFRHPTLSNGSTNIRTVGTAISLVVPSGATLGTVSAKLSRLVLLAIDNGGVVELAITNLSGGLNLDESALISTTAISAASNSANIVYSASARTNVPFRIVGYVESTQTTAGTWATTPTLVQGCGAREIVISSIIQGISVATTSGVAIDFTGIPAWVNRVTIVFNGVSTNGASQWRLQIGDGAVATSGYNSTSSFLSSGVSTSSSTSGFDIKLESASHTGYGTITLVNMGNNLWVASGVLQSPASPATVTIAGSKSLASSLDRVRLTTVSADTFDAGSVNILYE